MPNNCEENATNSETKDIVAACIKHFEANKDDCNKFLKAVANEVDVEDFKGNADEIIIFLEKEENSWTKLGAGEHKKAHDQAKDGKFVIAGMTSADLSDDHGHLSVVTAGDMEHSGMDKIDHPRGYWGSLGGKGKECKGMNYSFPSPERKKGIRYYWKSLPKS